jgi:SPP1 family predicted phage head-tail adaptor
VSPVRAGEFNRRVQLQKPTFSTDSEGRTSETWATVMTVWAAIEPLQGRESLLAAQVQTTLSHRVRLRGELRSLGITARWRIVYGAKIFDIQSITDSLEGHRELVLECQERELEE